MGRPFWMNALLCVIGVALIPLNLWCIAYFTQAYFVRRAPNEERWMFREMREAIARAHNEHHSLPTSIAFTPALETIGVSKQRWPADAPTAWRELGITPEDPIYFSYAIASDPGTGTITLIALGDLNGDGRREAFVQHGHTQPWGDPTGPLVWGEIEAPNDAPSDVE
jgi:hypothetical protein